MVLVGAWIITGLLLGVLAARFDKMRSWLSVGLATMAGSIVVLWLMLLTVEKIYGLSPAPTFNNADDMMVYFANEAARWVKKDRNINLDYSVDSAKIVEEELARISSDVDRANPQAGTFGLAMGYGAYVGEVIRRRHGGSWAMDHPLGGPRSYPLTTGSNSTVFPVGWCWKRLTVGEEDNVYHKVLLFSGSNGSNPNVTDRR